MSGCRHQCCSDPDPLHDHFLRTVDCPRCKAARSTSCRDVFPPHRTPPPGPPSVPRTCALPVGHDGYHERDGITWANAGRVCSCGHGEERHDDMYAAAALEGPRTCREVGCICRTFVEYVTRCDQ